MIGKSRGDEGDRIHALALYFFAFKSSCKLLPLILLSCYPISFELYVPKITLREKWILWRTMILTTILKNTVIRHPN